MYLGRLRKLNHTQCVQFAIFCAELALPVFEKEYPDDPRPRRAIDAARTWLENPCEAAATYAANDRDATYDAANDAARAANAVAFAANAAATYAVNAAYAATAAVDAATQAALALATRTAGSATAYAAAHATHAATYAANAGSDQTKIENYLLELEKCTSND